MASRRDLGIRHAEVAPKLGNGPCNKILLLIIYNDAMPLHMRIFLMILIVAVGFGGFPAAVHAFSKDSCDSVILSQMTDTSHDVCPDHGQDHNQKEKTGKDKAAESQCLDCVHCCACHAFNTSSDSIKFHLEASKAFLLLKDRPSGDYHFSLLRPPKDLV